MIKITVGVFLKNFDPYCKQRKLRIGILIDLQIFLDKIQATLCREH